jgi:hypothetical protein
MPIMTTRRDRRADAARITSQIRNAIGTEIKDGRITSGVSQEAAGRSVGMSHAQFGRIERATLPNVTVAQLACACSAVGLKLVVRAYPSGEPIRDAAQLALMDRFRSRLPDDFRIRFEVPLPILSDPRAWDAVVSPPADEEFAIEAESRLYDVQAMDRRIALKQRDGAMGRVILLVNDTPSNRRTLVAHRDSLRDRFRLDTTEILRTLRVGRAPTDSGIVVL